MSQGITNRQQLIEVLQELQTPSSNESRKRAEKVLGQFARTPSALPGFMEIIKEHPIAPLRQMTSIILKNRIGDLWSKVDVHGRELVKAQLLEIVSHEQVRLVRIAIAQIIGSIASIEIPNDSWKELAQFLLSCVKSEVASQRELGMILFGSLLTSTPNEIMALFDHMINFFQAGLEDSDENVRAATVKAAGALLDVIQSDEQFAKFLTLISPLVKNLQHYVQLNDSHPEIVDDIFSLFNDFVTVEFNEIEKAIPPLVQYMVELCCNTDLDINLRDRASTVLGFVIKFNPNFAIKSNLVQNLIVVILKLMTEPEPEDVDDEDVTAFSFASSILDEIAIDIPSKHTFQLIVEKAIELVKQPNPYAKKAGISALGLISEGCNELMKANIAKFIPIALTLSQDDNKIVREAAISTVVHFVEYLIPDVVVFYADIIPLVMKGLDDPHQSVKEKTCYALDALSNVLKPHQISPYLEELMTKLISLLQNSQRSIQKVVLSAIGNLANASKANFLPYFDAVINIMRTVMSSTDEANLGLRARATEATGIIAESVGLEKFGPYIQFFMNLALQNFSLPEENELAEYSFHFFGNISRTMKEQFTPYLKTVVEIILQSVSKLEGANIFEEEEGEEEDIEFAESYQLNIRTSEIDEKGAAILALGSVADSVGVEFRPYFEDSLSLLSQYAEYPHPHIRRQVVIALKSIVCSVVPKPVTKQIQEKKIRDVVDTLVELYISKMYQDDDAETVARSCESVASMCRELGIAAIERNLKELVKVIIVLLKREGVCNQTQLEEGEDEDHDLVLIDAVSDLIDDVARCVGPPFVVHFKKIFPILIKYLDHSAIDDRVMAIGTLAEVCKAIGSESDPFVDEIFRYALKSASENHFNVKRNALFGLGVLAQNSPHKAAPHLMNIVNLAVPVMQQATTLEAGLVDNACGCIARLILYHADKIPLAQILPILLQALPLREDYQENETVYNSIFKLIETQNPVAANNFPSILKVFGQVLGGLNVSDTIQQKIVDVLKALRVSVGDESLRNVISGLDAPIAEKITRAIQ